jgi:hypothetical protein
MALLQEICSMTVQFARLWVKTNSVLTAGFVSNKPTNVMLAYFNLVWTERSEVRIPAATGGFSILQNAQITSGAHPDLFLMYDGVLCWAEASGTTWRWPPPSNTGGRNEWSRTFPPLIFLPVWQIIVGYTGYPNDFANLSLTMVFNCRCRSTGAKYIRLRSYKLFPLLIVKRVLIP